MVAFETDVMMDQLVLLIGYHTHRCTKCFCAWERNIDDKIVPGNDVCWEPKREFVNGLKFCQEYI